MSATDYEEVRAGINRIEAENAALRAENERLAKERDEVRRLLLEVVDDEDGGLDEAWMETTYGASWLEAARATLEGK